MATQENSPGLLSKVASFVRTPASDKGAVDQAEAADSGENSKQALKRMIERKAQNDSVRKREFSRLRKLRNVSPAVATEMAARPSFFRDSSGYSVIDERATTLKKIDEIEAQMSKQWWKGRQAAISAEVQVAQGPQAARPPISNKGQGAETGFAPTITSDLSSNLDDVPTQMGFVAAPSAAVSKSVNAAAPTSRQGFELTSSSVFSASKMVSIDMGQNLSDPTLEEAAIRFANGDDVGAETVLVAALQAPDAQQESADVWSEALFDLYRATGQQENFERVAMDFAQRYGRSAPSWFSMPQDLGLSPVAAPSADPGSARAAWVCPSELDGAAVERLRMLMNLGSEPSSLDWRMLEDITPEAGQTLALLFANWCEQPLTLHCVGMESLERVLRINTPMGGDKVPPFWWHLRLDTLRILCLQDEFERVALDFCVTYEVSPPSWQPALCQRAYGQHVDTHVMEWREDSSHVALLMAADSRSAALAVPANARTNQLVMSGEVLGDAATMLKPLQAATHAGGSLVVDCTKLIRVDFSAAGSILNWVATAQASGGQIELRDVPHLVAAFFNLIGINEHARITVRNN